MCAGSPLELTCEAVVDPDTPMGAVNLSWTGPSGVLIANQSREETAVRRVLSVLMVGLDHIGTFTCAATVAGGGDALNREASVDLAVISELMNKERV